MLTLCIFAVLLVLIMIDLPIAVAIALTAIAFFVGLGQCFSSDHAAPEDVCLHHRVCSARRPLLHPGRKPDEYRGGNESHLRFAKAL